MNLKDLCLIAMIACSLANTPKAYAILNENKASSQRVIPIHSNTNLSYLNGQLARAALDGNIPETKRLIAAGADVNSQQFCYDPGFHPMGGAKEIKDMTILVYLLMEDTVNLDVLKALMDAGANPALKDSNGQNAFTLTASNTNEELHNILHRRMS